MQRRTSGLREARFSLQELLAGQPVSAQNAVIQRLQGIVVGDAADEGEAQGGAACARMPPQVGAQECLAAEAPGRSSSRVSRATASSRVSPRST
ncbi:MAG: hypothetical protein WDM77_22495 [Steroidobacteraceae bacterium]